MDLVLKVADRELLAGERGRFFSLKHAIFAGIAACVMVGGLAVGVFMHSATIGLQIFQALSFSAVAAMYVAPMLGAATALFREKQDGALPLLLLTNVSPARLVAGKLLSAVFHGTFHLLLMFPMFVLAAALGGISAPQIVLAFVALLGVMFFGSCAGLLFAALTPAAHAARGLTLACVGMAVLLTALTCAASGTVPPREILSPFTALNALIERGAARPAMLITAVHLVAGLLAAAAATAALAARRGALASRSADDTSPALALRWRTRDGRPHSFCIPGNPVTWRDLHAGYGGARTTWVHCGIMTAVIFAASCLAHAAGLLLIEPLAASLALTGFASIAIFALLSVVRGCRSFGQEQGDRIIELLLLTDLAPGELVKGKFSALFRSTAPWAIVGFGASLASLALAGMLGVVSTFVFSAGFMTLWSCFTQGAAFACMGVWLSPRYRQSTVFISCAVAFVLWNSFLRYVLGAVLMGAFMRSSFSIAVIGADFALGLMFASAAHSNLRERALRSEG